MHVCGPLVVALVDGKAVSLLDPHAGETEILAFRFQKPLVMPSWSMIGPFSITLQVARC